MWTHRLGGWWAAGYRLNIYIFNKVYIPEYIQAYTIFKKNFNSFASTITVCISMATLN